MFVIDLKKLEKYTIVLLCRIFHNIAELRKFKNFH